MTATAEQETKRAAQETATKAAGLFDHAARTFGETLKASFRVQEEWAKSFSDAIKQVTPTCEFQKQSASIFAAAIPIAQKNTEELMKAIEQNYKKSLELLRKAFDTQNPETTADLQSRTQRLWEDSVQLFRENTDALTAANIKIVENWSEVIRKGGSGTGKL
jgi:hypothetical protein